MTSIQLSETTVAARREARAKRLKETSAQREKKLVKDRQREERWILRSALSQASSTRAN